MRNKICLYTPPYSDITSYFEMVDIAAKYGLSLETISLLELSEPDIEFAKKLRRYADEKGVKIPCVSLGINLVGDDSAEMIEKAKRYADIAAILGSPYLHHTVAFYYRDPDKVLEKHDHYLEKGIQAIREVYDYAKTLGVRTIYEDQGFIFNGVKGFANVFESKRDVGVVADFGNISGVDEKIEDFIPVYADKIVHVHVKDYLIFEKGSEVPGAFASVSGTLHKEVPFGKGVVDMDKVFGQIKDMDYDGYYGLECESAEGEEGVKIFEENIAFVEKYLSK